MRFSFWVVVAAAVLDVFASPTHHVLHEKRDAAPHNWVKRSRLHERMVIPLKFALAQQNLHLADRYMWEVAHPASPSYGQHWTAKQVAEAFAPSKENVEIVGKWLIESGIEAPRIKLSSGKNWLQVNATIAEAQRLLKTEYYIYEHDITGTPQVACHEYHLPPHITPLVDFVTPTVHFDAQVHAAERKHHKREITPLPKRKRDISADLATLQAVRAQERAEADKEIAIQRSGTAARIGISEGSVPGIGATLADDDVMEQLENCDLQITPACLRTLYEIPEGTSASDENAYGIVEYSPQTYLQSDLDKWFGNFSSDQIGLEPAYAPINGGVLLNQPANRSFDLQAESDLDLEYAMALAYPMKVTLYQVGDAVQGASFNNFLDAIDADYCNFQGGDDPEQDAVYPLDPTGYIGPANCGGFPATKVISTSYGYNEADLTEPYERRQCAEYMKLALQGVTVLYSSGDFGVAGNMGRCIDSATGNYTARNASFGVFNPSFPSGCPWVTSVGATQVPNNTDIIRELAVASATQPEMACETVIQSGGGFSNVFEMPDYQRSHVAGWWSDHPPSYGSDRFNNSQRTRGFPDISVNGANYVVAVSGNFTLIYGTSASAPVLGAMVALINEERMKMGKGSVGFLNQVLYEHPEVMKDVVRGTNRGCGTPGFSAVEGWDPLTGLGTPIYPRMLDLFKSLP